MAQLVGAGAAPCARAGGAADASMPAAPTAGGLLVGAVKKRFLGSKTTRDTAAADSAGAPCASGETTAASSALRTAGSVAMAASPAGLAVTAGAAAAPHAGRAIRSLSGRFRRGGESAESMRKSLASGRLEVRGISFAAGSAEPSEGFEGTIAQLAEAIGSVEGRFVVRVSPESRDAALAARRAAAITMHLQLAGVAESRLSLGAAEAPTPAVAPGQARVTITRREDRP
jgi:hypothetical protein